MVHIDCLPLYIIYYFHITTGENNSLFLITAVNIFSHHYCRKQFTLFFLSITVVNIRNLQGSCKSRQIPPTLKQQLSLNGSWNILWNTWKPKQTRSRSSGSSCRVLNKDLIQRPILIWLLPYLSPEVEKYRWQLPSKLRLLPIPLSASSSTRLQVWSFWRRWSHFKIHCKEMISAGTDGLSEQFGMCISIHWQRSPLQTCLIGGGAHCSCTCDSIYMYLF